MRMIATLCLTAALGAAASLVNSAPVAAQPKIELKVDLVEAMREFARWIGAVFTTGQAAAGEAKRTAVAEIGTDLLEIAAIKRAIGESLQEALWSSGPENQLLEQRRNQLLEQRTRRLGELVQDLNRRIRELDPDWRALNVATLSALFDAQAARGTKAAFLEWYLISLNAGGRHQLSIESQTVDSRVAVEFALRQASEADELRQLAERIMASAQVAPTR